MSVSPSGSAEPAPALAPDVPIATGPAMNGSGKRPFEDFFENSTVPMHVVGADGMILRANAAELDLLGYAPQDYIGRPIADFHVSRPAVEGLFASVSRGEALRNHPARLRAKDGSIKHVLLNANGHFENGAFAYSRCISVDVTDLERAREAAVERDWRASRLLEMLPVAIYTTDAQGRITFYNEAAAAFWGCRPEIGKSEFCGSWKLYWSDGTPLAHAECPMAVALKENRPVRGMEAIAERPDGTRVPFIPFPEPFYDSAGTMIGAINLLVDISDRKEAERERGLLAAIVDSSNDAIVSKTLEGVITSWNAGAQRIFGYTADEIVGKSVLTLIPDDRKEEERVIIGRLKKGERIEHYETVRRRKDGTLVDVSLTISPVRNGKGEVVGASKSARDITERKKADQRLVTLAHEVDHRSKNLLAVIHAMLELTSADTADALKTKFRGRIGALGHANKLLSEGRWTGADLRSLVEEELAPYREDGRTKIRGEQYILRPELAQSVALTVHELATNAAKYGSLSRPTGKVTVEWSREADRIHLRWTERGGPPVEAAGRKGFGTGAIERMVRGHQGGEIRFDWQRDGLVCDVTFAAENLGKA